MLTTDSRESWREYEKAEPYFFTPQEALFQGVPDFRDIELHVISCWQKPMRAPTQLARNIWFHGLVVPKIGWMRTGYQGCIRAVRKKLQELQPDIVHGQGTERDCAISAALSGFPSVVTVHGNMRAIAKLLRPRPFSYLWLAAKLERWTLPRTDGVICISHYTRELVRPLAQRTWVLPNAVDASLFEVKNRPEVPAQILCVAHVQERKNQIRLLEALDPLAKEFQFVLTLYGKASDRDPFARRVLELTRQRLWCRHGGFADSETIKAALQTASLLVLPSLEENCPMSVLEAMAAGVPVVAAKVGGIPDLFQDDVSGLFCDPLDTQTIRGAVRKVLNDRVLASRIASEARKRALACFHPRVIAQEHIRIYREVLSTCS